MEGEVNQLARLRRKIATVRIIECLHQALCDEQILLRGVAPGERRNLTSRLIEPRDLTIANTVPLHIEGNRFMEGDVRLLGQDRIKSIPLLLLARLEFRLVVGPLMQVVDRLPRLVRHLLAELNHLGEDDLFFGGEEANTANLFKVHAYRIVDADRFGHHFAYRLGDLCHLWGRNLEQRCGGSFRIKDLYAVCLDLREVASSWFSDPGELRRWIQLCRGALLRRAPLWRSCR